MERLEKMQLLNGLHRFDLFVLFSLQLCDGRLGVIAST